jgi:hypothetical protein
VTVLLPAAEEEPEPELLEGEELAEGEEAEPVEGEAAEAEEGKAGEDTADEG